jgi:hypothetical protein
MMRLMPLALAVSLVLPGLGLAGCNGTDLNSMLEGAQPPDDQLQGAKAPPLSLPPDYNLRPPVPGARGAPDRQNVDIARQSLFGTNEPGFVTPGAASLSSTTGRSAGETALLKKANAKPDSSSSIRSTVDKETDTLTESEEGFTDKLLKYDKDAANDDNPSPDSTLKTIVSGEQKPAIERTGSIFD